MNTLSKRFLWGAVIVFVALPVARYLAVGDRKIAPEEASAKRYSAVGSETQVLVSKQDSEGITDGDLTVEAANRLGEYSLERVRFHAQKILNQMNSSETAASITADSVVMNVGNKNLVVTRFHLGSHVPFIQFFGIDGSEASRVLCMTAPTADVVIAGNCDAKLQEVFGVSLAAVGDGLNG